MKLGVFTIFDAKVAAYAQPFFSQSRGSAIRAVSDALADPQHPFSRHPEDYSLFDLGMYDDQSGAFDLLAAPEQVATALSLLPKK